jgi:hypothetical protein
MGDIEKIKRRNFSRPNKSIFFYKKLYHSHLLALLAPFIIFLAVHINAILVYTFHKFIFLMLVSNKPIPPCLSACP